jgi:hypothetical protein
MVQKIDLYNQVTQLYWGTQAGVEASTGVPEGAIGYATDLHQSGYYNGTNWVWGGGTGFTQEQIEDFVGAMVTGNTETGIDVTYDDTNGKLNFDAQTAGDLRYADINKGVTSGDAHDHGNVGAAAAVDHSNLNNAGSDTGHVTNGDSHDHSGGDGGQIAYANLSGLPATETQTNNIYRVANSPGGTSAFVGTIATLPGGAPTTLTYNITSGQEGAMAVSATTALAKMRLYNTTRGTSALISQCTTGTNTITLTANVPAGWTVGDAITIASQTVSGGSVDWVDLEITSGPTGKTDMFLAFQIVSATAGDTVYFHPFESYVSSKQFFAQVYAANRTTFIVLPVKVIGNVFAIGWTGTPTAVVVQEAGYLQ